MELKAFSNRLNAESGVLRITPSAGKWSRLGKQEGKDE